MSYRTNLTTQIENALQQVLEHEADTRARATGFVQRQRKLTGSTFDWLDALRCHQQSLSHLHRLDASRRRCRRDHHPPKLAHFLYALLQHLAACVITTCTPEVAPLLERFAGVFIAVGIAIPLDMVDLAAAWFLLGDEEVTRLQIRDSGEVFQLIDAAPVKRNIERPVAASVGEKTQRLRRSRDG
jgi:hypothetical protein